MLSINKTPCVDFDTRGSFFCFFIHRFNNGIFTVSKYVASVAKELGGNIKVTGYIRYDKGEGIQKREENYGEEIAKMTGG